MKWIEEIKVMRLWARYLDDKYGHDYCISAEQSISLHSGNSSVPRQLVIRAPKASNLVIHLLHNTSLFVMKSPLPVSAEITLMNGIRMLTLPSALIHCSKIMFEKSPIEMRTVLTLIKDSAELLGQLLNGFHSVIAGRLAGAFRNNGQERIADDIVKVMKSAGFNIRETDPFESEPPIELSFIERSPYANKLKLMWNQMREVVMNHFPDAPGLPKDQGKYLKSVDKIYVTDAYHSLSIEKYVVSAELIKKVRSGEWDIANNEEDRKQRDTMAARGYWLATQAVKESIRKVLGGDNSGIIAKREHIDWYRELFAPSVTTGLLKPSDLAGYRTNQVYIAQSMHVPMNKVAVRDAMPVLFELLETEISPAVRSVLGHFIFVYIHPYMDGNGRMARFLMNVMLASGGYPWTVIPLQARNNYMSSLEKASVDGDIYPFVEFIAELVNESLRGNPVAKLID